MKMTSLLIACGLAIAPFACKKDKHDNDGIPSPKSVESAEKSAMEARSEVQDQQAEFARKRDEFVTRAKTTMSSLDARVAALKADIKANASKLKGDTRKNVDELMNDIGNERAKAEAAFNAAATGAKDRWDDLEKNTGEALDKLGDKANVLAEKLKSAGVKLRAEADQADE